MSNSKNYRVEGHGGGDCDNAPSVVVFDINEETAREIVKLAALVKTHDLHKVEMFDYRARFLQFDPETDPEDAEEAGGENDVRTECDVLVVGGDEFWFSAYIKHTDVRVSCEGQPIEELMAHFGLAAETRSSVEGVLAQLEAEKQDLVSQRDEALQFVEHVAGLSIWDYDKNDGTPYQECPEPSDGYLDSHRCLMALIEEARGFGRDAKQPVAEVSPDKVRLVIGLDGGIIQGVTANVPLDYLVYDYDVEGCSDNEVATRPALDRGEVKVYDSGWSPAEVDAEKIAEVFNAVISGGNNETSETCTGCGAEAESIIGCPDGAELCQQCFDAGRH